MEKQIVFYVLFGAAQTQKWMFLKVLAAQAGWGIFQKKEEGGGAKPHRDIAKTFFYVVFGAAWTPKTNIQNLFFMLFLGPPKPEYGCFRGSWWHRPAGASSKKGSGGGAKPHRDIAQTFFPCCFWGCPGPKKRQEKIVFLCHFWGCPYQKMDFFEGPGGTSRWGRLQKKEEGGAARAAEST